MCRYALCAGMCQYVWVCISYCCKNTCTYLRYLHIQAIPTYTDIPAHTFDPYTYRQYLLIVKYLHIPAIPLHTCNTYKYRHTYTYTQYMQIHTHTCNIYRYLHVFECICMYVDVCACMWMYV